MTCTLVLDGLIIIVGDRWGKHSVFGSYLDESFDMKHTGVFAVGGILARGVAIFELERRWEKLRQQPDINIGYFKASECQFGKGEFRKFVVDPANITPDERARLDGISREFHKAIVTMPYHESSYVIATGIGLVQDDFYEIIKDVYARSILGSSPYRLTYDLALIQCAWAAKELKMGDAVAFTCDESELKAEAYEAYRKLKDSNPAAAAHLGVFEMDDEKRCQPLQAADAVIYEIRRVLGLALRRRRGALREQFGILAGKNAMFLIQHTKKANLLHIVQTHKPNEPFKLDEIMDQQFNEDIKFDTESFL